MMPSSLRSWLLLGGLWGCLCAPHLAHAEAAAAPTTTVVQLARADQQQLRPQQALERIDAWLDQGGLSRTETLQAWALKGELLAQMDEGQAAEAAFRVVLRIAPQWTLPRDVVAAAEGPYTAARVSLPAPSEGFSVTTTTRTIGGRQGIEVVLVADDLDAIGGCGLVGTSTIYPLSAETPIAFIPASQVASTSPSPAAKAFAVAIVDRQGNTWAVKRSASSPVPDDAVRWLTVTGAATTFVGLLGASGFAIGYTAAAASDDTVMATSLLALVGAASVVAGAGAVMVVVDELFLRPSEEDDVAPSAPAPPASPKGEATSPQSASPASASPQSASPQSPASP